MLLCTLFCKIICDNFWSAFCVFHAHFWEKTHSFKICALKKCNHFRQLKRSNFRVEKCETGENLSKFLNNMTYKTVTSIRDCVTKRKFMYNMNIFVVDKMQIPFNQNKSCVKSCQKHIALKKQQHCFHKKPLFSNMCTFFIPLFWNEKLLLYVGNACDRSFICPCAQK